MKFTEMSDIYHISVNFFPHHCARETTKRAVGPHAEKESEMFGKALSNLARVSVTGLVATGYALSVLRFSGVA